MAGGTKLTIFPFNSSIANGAVRQYFLHQKNSTILHYKIHK